MAITKYEEFGGLNESKKDTVEGLGKKLVPMIGNNLKSLDRKLVKKATMKLLLTDMVEGLMKNGSEFDDLDRKDFKAYKANVLAFVFSNVI